MTLLLKGIIIAAFSSITFILPYLSSELLDERYRDSLWYPVLELALPYRFQIALVVALIMGLQSLYSIILNPVWRRFRRTGWEFRSATLDIVAKQLFQVPSEVRITIFRDMSFLRALWTYSTNLVRGRVCARSFPLYWNILGFKRRKYIAVWQRRDSDEFPKSRTFFIWSPDTETECEALVGRIRKGLEAKKKTRLPDIRDIDLTRVDLGNNRSAETKKVKEYMSECNIPDLRTLQRINLLARHIYADVLYDKEGSPIGAIVVDSVQKEDPFNDDVEQWLGMFASLIGSTL